jgi:glycosyltransferase involved in cell wall biosynthesis
MNQQPESFAPSVAHRLWRAIPPSVRRRGLSHATAWLAPRPDPAPPPCRPGLVVGGELSRASGLGEGARLMVHGARRLGLPVWTVDISPPVDARVEVPLQAGPPPPPGVPLVLHINGPMLPLALLRQPRGLLRGRRVVGYWAWELPHVPPEWRTALQFVHEIWVPSRFTAAALEPLMPGRVRIVLPPLAAAPPVPAALDRQAFGLPDHAVVVLVSFNLASSFARKNPLAAIAAFRAAFGTRQDRVLLLKVTHGDHAPEDMLRLREAAQAPNIRVEDRVLPPADRHALTAAADIVLSLHRSEGFGLVPAEAMMLRRPVVATGWSGNLTYMDPGNAALVGYRLVPTEDSRSVYHDSIWAEPDLTEAVGQLRRLADDAAARSALGEQARAAATASLGAETLSAAIRGLGVSLPH